MKWSPSPVADNSQPLVNCDVPRSSLVGGNLGCTLCAPPQGVPCRGKPARDHVPQPNQSEKVLRIIRNKTFNNGSLGYRIDEERSKMR